jgi:hypothetical protein
MLVRAYTKSMQAIVNAATGATTVLLFKGRGNGLFGDGGAGALAGTEASVVPPGPRGWDSRAPMVVWMLLYIVVQENDVRMWLTS